MKDYKDYSCGSDEKITLREVIEIVAEFGAAMLCGALVISLAWGIVNFF